MPIDETTPFVNRTVFGHEKAIRKGKTVPPDAVNLAYFKSPDLTPKDNIVIIDTAHTISENIINHDSSLGDGTRKLYYADALGILEDESGNRIVDDEYPLVTDVFNVEEDWSILPGSEYTAESMLPFMHVSRYFHIDFAEQATSSGFFNYVGDQIQVTYHDGRPYVNSDNIPLFKIKLAAAELEDVPANYEQWAYRVVVYIDVDDNEDLYLTYNKVEIDATLNIRNHSINFRERINPIPVFEYQPEESLVVDPENRDKKWYSSRAATLKEEALGISTTNVDGYKIYAPRKAVPDPRLFQLFRWRVRCDFSQNVKVDPSKQQGVLRCGVVVTNRDPKSRTPYALYNLARSAYNTNGINFINPLTEANTNQVNTTPRESAAYWYVNFDTISNVDLAKFDLLIWSPSVANIDMQPYSSKINYFINSCAGTLFFDTNNATIVTNAPVENTLPTNRGNGVPRGNSPTYIGPGPSLAVRTSVATSSVAPEQDTIQYGGQVLGGWDITSSSDLQGMSYIKALTPNGFSQSFVSLPTRFNSVISCTSSDHITRYFVIKQNTTVRHMNNGVFWSSWGTLMSCSALLNFSTASIANMNQGTSIANVNNYNGFINSSHVAGAYKFLYNVALLAVKNKILDDSDEFGYSTTWTYYTDWKSSWAIDADNDILSDEEKTKYDFFLLPQDLATPVPVWQRRLNTKTYQELIDDSLTSDMKNKIAGASRTYTLELTNPEVTAAPIMSQTDQPFAWTKAYTPPFTVPADMGPHVIREEEVKAQYEAGQYISRSYPSKPYAGRIRSSYIASFHQWADTDAQWTVTGTATETVTVTKHVDPYTTSVTSNVQLSWNNTSKGFWTDIQNPYMGASAPVDIRTGQDFHYYNYNSWVFWGIVGSWKLGSSGDVVSFMQEALNRFQFYGIYRLPGGKALKVDGYYGVATQEAIRQLQNDHSAKYVDGVVDAETLSIIGGQILRLGSLATANTNPNDYTRFFQWALDRMPRQNVFDGNGLTSYSKRSWIKNGPAVISEDFFIKYARTYKIHGVTVIPFLEGSSNRLLVSAVDAKRINSINDFGSWKANQALMHDLTSRPISGEEFYLPFRGPVNANSIAVSLVQDQPSFGSARMIGVRDIIAHAEVTSTTTNPAVDVITHQTRTIPITATGHVVFANDRIVSIRVHPNYTGTGKLSNIKWTSSNTDSPSIISSVTEDGLLTLTADVIPGVSNNSDPTQYIFGVQFPPQPDVSYHKLYSMNEQGVVNPIRETGFIRKDDGIKLLCTQTGHPWGFNGIDPDGQIISLLPTSVGTADIQRHFVKFSIDTTGVDPSIRIGFYDKAAQEFITSPNGDPEISLLEYFRRGVRNIFIGIVSSYELDERVNIPDSDGVSLPYRWAMPVYGVYKRNTAKIALDVLPEKLGRDDFWPVPIRTGNFSRSIAIPDGLSSTTTHYLDAYRGTIVQAFYGVPEANLGNWSKLYGPPNVDVIGEEPVVLDDKIIQVRQAPILMKKMPTGYSPFADPVRPIVKVYTRHTVNNPWILQPLTEIVDINASTGEIFLKTKLPSLDSSLVKVDYTTHLRSYYYKGTAADQLNLNPYPGHSRGFIGKPIYIYLLPEYIRDSQGHVISSSVQTRCIRHTDDPSIFDPLSFNYDPSALQLGLIYMSTALNIDSLALVDTRRRGGGLLETVSNDEIIRLMNEASAFWDFQEGAGASYQRGGYVIIRLPVELKEYMNETEIREVIDRNFTAGSTYDIQDLQGNPWS